MAIELSENQKTKLLDTFIKEYDSYSKDDFKELRDTISDNYYVDIEFLKKISVSKEKRDYFSSPKLLNRIVSDFGTPGWDFQHDDVEVDLLELVLILQKHEDNFFTTGVYINSLKFLEQAFDALENEIETSTNIEKTDKHSSEYYSLFKRIVGNINLQESDKAKFQSLYKKIEIDFKLDNYKEAARIFKYVFYFHDKGKLDNSIETDAKNTTIAFIQTTPEAKKLKEVLESACEMSFFMDAENGYYSHLYDKCTKIKEYAYTFYSHLEDSQKQKLVESWVPVNRNKPTESLKEILEKIEFDIPDVGKLADKILSTTKVLTVLTEKHKLFNIFSSLTLEVDTYDFSNYSDQVINLIGSGDISIQNIGMIELQRNKVAINKAKLKEKAEEVLITFFKNIASFHPNIKNILDAKIGVTKTYIDKIINEHAAIKSQIISYLTNTGSIEFYNMLVPKINTETLKYINTTLINTISNNAIYKDLINVMSSKAHMAILDKEVKKTLQGLKS